MPADLDRLSTLGLPLPGGQRQKVFTIYACNVFGEGGMVSQTGSPPQAMKDTRRTWLQALGSASAALAVPISLGAEQVVSPRKRHPISLSL